MRLGLMRLGLMRLGLMRLGPMLLMRRLKTVRMSRMTLTEKKLVTGRRLMSSAERCRHRSGDITSGGIMA